MHTGMLWFSNDPNRELADKVSDAVEYYHKKYGRVPDLCLVHPNMLTEDHRINAAFEMTLRSKAKIYVRPYRPVLPGHIWIGIEDKN